MRGAINQVSRLPLTRRAMHRLSVATRGAAVAFLRCRRLVPDTGAGRSHPDRAKGSAITPRELERALRDAQRTLAFVHVGEALSALTDGQRLQGGAAVLTLDESFAASAELALPVCRKLGVPVLFFVTTGHLEGGTTLWDQEIHAIVSEAAPEPLVVPWIDRVLRTDSRQARASAVRRLILMLASLDEERLARRIEELRQRVGGRPLVSPLDRMLTTGEVERLSQDPLVAIAAHGHRHLALSSASDAGLEDELVRPRKILRDVCGDAFADVVSYPFGRAPYVDERAVHAARAAGYRAAFTAHPGVSRPGDHLFRLPRLPLGRRTSGIASYELQGMSEAIDELILFATGEKTRVDAPPEG